MTVTATRFVALEFRMLRSGGIRLVWAALALVAAAGCGDEKGNAGPGSFRLNVLASGPGAVSSSPAGIADCTEQGGTCVATFGENATVKLTATWNADSARFYGWGGSCSGADTECTVAMTDHRHAIATFHPASGVGGIGDAFGLTGDDQLFSFDVAAPGVLRSLVPVGNFDATGEDLVGIDFNPADGLLYGLAKSATGTAGRIYLINRVTAAATFVCNLDAPLAGGSFGLDFDPVNGSLRVLSKEAQTLEVQLGAGTCASSAGTNTVYSGLTGVAYTDSFVGTATSTLYAVDSNQSKLVELEVAPTPRRKTSRDLGVPITAANGFDIDPRTGMAYLAYMTSAPQLGTVDLQTGTVTPRGAIGGVSSIAGLAIAAPAAPEVFGVRMVLNNGTLERQELVRFGPLTPQAVWRVGAITGLGSDVIAGIDFRAADGLLYALGRRSDGSSQLYTLSTTTAAATPVGSRTVAGTLDAAIFGMDFDPATDRIRVVGTTGQNLRLNPANGAVVAVDGGLKRAGARLTGLAFTDSQQQAQQGGGAPKLYAIDTANGRLGLVNTSTSDGRFERPLSLGLTAAALNDLNGFEIIGRSDVNPDPQVTTPDLVALAAFGSASATESVLYRIDLDTGHAQALGRIGPAQSFQRRVAGIAAMPEANPSVKPNQDIHAITEGSQDVRLISFSRSNPGSLTRNCALGGLEGGVVLGLDILPAPAGSIFPGLVYALVDAPAPAPNRLVRIDLTTCAVDAALSRDLTGGGEVLDGKSVGMDFDASSGMLRVTTERGDHMVIDPATGAVQPRTAISERAIAVAAAAYASGPSPLLYDLNLDATPIGPMPTLMLQEPDSGTVSDVSVLFRDDCSTECPIANNTSAPPSPPAAASLDIFGVNGSLALAVLRQAPQGTPEGFTRLYRIDLGTGQLTELPDDPDDPGGIGPRRQLMDPQIETRMNVTDIAIRFPPVP